uniref:WASH complex subunit 4 N-terminal domain-containing protein n=1 Tax=Plectus sambesii TaxID=2011161 RepID=A0A914WZS6_9BILA
MTAGSMERPTGDIACTSQLKRYGQFIEDLQNRLRRTEESMEIVDRSYIVQCQSVPTESASLSELVRSGNDVIDKTLVVLASLCSEVDSLKAEAECKFYPALLAYGEDVQGYLTQEGGALRLIGQMLPCLQELSVFINRCYEVCRNVVLQMASLFSNQ